MAVPISGTINISIARQFSRTPGPRCRDEGEWSGEQFRDELLEPAFLKGRETKQRVRVDLDGVFGYGTSFLEEVFGGLARKYPPEDVEKWVYVVSVEEPYLVEDVSDYIRQARIEGG